MTDQSEIQDRKSELPWVTCLCCTYGRFQRLRESVTSFLAQDYPNKLLFILNDAPVPIHEAEALGRDHVVVFNETKRYANLGLKRQQLLDTASTPFVAHWEDDDLYLPWHISRSVAALFGVRRLDTAYPSAPRFGCVKSAGGFYMKGVLPRLELPGIQHNAFEGTMVFRREDAQKLGGYAPLHSGQAKALMNAFARAHKLLVIPDKEEAADSQRSAVRAEGCQLTAVSYIYRWNQGVGHISAIGNADRKSGGEVLTAAEVFAQQNRDIGTGEPLSPADLAPYWTAVLECARNVLSTDDYAAFERRLEPHVDKRYPISRTGK